MKFCQRCGKELTDEAVFCPGCGYSADKTVTVQQTKTVDQSVSVGLVILAVLIPLFGIIYWPVCAKSRPKCAKACGIAAIISWVVSFILTMLMNGNI